MPVELFTTTTPSTAVQRTEISRARQLLDIKKVVFVEVGIMGWGEGTGEAGRDWSSGDWARRPLPALPLLQTDLAADATARLRMWAASGDVKDIPQLHVGGKVGGGGGGAGARRRRRPRPTLPPRLLPFQFVGTFSTIQEMEDFGELDAALKE